MESGSQSIHFHMSLNASIEPRKRARAEPPGPDSDSRSSRQSAARTAARSPSQVPRAGEQPLRSSYLPRNRLPWLSHRTSTSPFVSWERPPSLGRLEQAFLIRYLRFPSIPNLLGCLFELELVVPRLVVENDSSRPDGLSRLVLQHQFHLEVITRLVDLEVALSRLDHPHVVFVRLLADSANIGRNYHVVGFVRRGDVHCYDDHLRMLRQSFINEFLCIGRRRRLRGSNSGSS